MKIKYTDDSGYGIDGRYFHADKADKPEWLDGNEWVLHQGFAWYPQSEYMLARSVFRERDDKNAYFKYDNNYYKFNEDEPIEIKEGA